MVPSGPMTRPSAPLISAGRSGRAAPQVGVLGPVSPAPDASGTSPSGIPPSSTSVSPVAPPVAPPPEPLAPPLDPDAPPDCDAPPLPPPEEPPLPAAGALSSLEQLA